MAIVQQTLVVNPSSYDSTDYSYHSLSYPTRAYAGTSSTNYSSVYLTRGADAVTYIYFKFDTSSIPENATIDSVSCSVKVLINNISSSNISARQVQMSTGTTLKGTSSRPSTSANILSLDVGSWTRAEISDARIRLYAKRASGNVDTSYYFRLYGAELTVVYSYDDAPPVTIPLRVKQNGSWVTPSKVLVKNNGSWTEASKILVKDNGTWK